MTIKYVSKIQNGKISISDSDIDLCYASELEMLNLIERLIDKGYAFVDEPAGWPPAAILQDLKSKQVFNKAFIAITWSGPHDYRTFKM